MKTKRHRWATSTLIAVMLLLITLCGESCSQTREFWATWSYYPETGSQDVSKLRLYELKITAADTAIVKVWSDSINVQWTTHRFTIADDDSIHLFAMTAVDSSKNESIFSAIKALDLKRPSSVLDFRVK